jgi:hypothetical protein
MLCVDGFSVTVVEEEHVYELVSGAVREEERGFCVIRFVSAAKGPWFGRGCRCKITSSVLMCSPNLSWGNCRCVDSGCKHVVGVHNTFLHV